MILIVVGSWIILIGLLFVFQGGLPDFIPLSMGADNGIIFHPAFVTLFVGLYLIVNP